MRSNLRKSRNVDLKDFETRRQKEKNIKQIRSK